MTQLATITEVQRSLFELAGAPTGWGRVLGVAALVGLCYAVVWLYRRERRAGAGRGLRAALAVGRCAVLLGLAAVWVEPVIATYIVRSVSGRVAVVVDGSASMSVRDSDPVALPAAGADAAPTRFEHVLARLTAGDGDWLRRLQERNELSLYVFGDDALPVALPGVVGESDSVLDALDSVRPTRAHTDIGRALATVLDDLGDSPIAGVVLISDGGVNRGTTVPEMVAQARRFKAPLYTVGIGSPREPPNLRITNVAAPGTVPPADPFEVRVELAAAGVASGEVEVELTAEPVGSVEAAQRVASRRVTLGEDALGAPLLFEVSPPAPGEYLYRARVAALPGEAIDADNVRETTVLVLDERLRVLVVAGGPSFEYRYVTPLLTRDKSIDVSCWLQSADSDAIRDGDTRIEHLPRRPEELFDYDVVLLLDANPTELDASWAVTLRRWVDELGGGVLVQAGPHFATRFMRDARLQDLVSILPVTPDPDADVRLNTQGTYRLRPWPIQLPEAAVAHPLVSLHAEPDTNRAIWQALPGVWWHLPVLRAKPVATVLLEHGGGAQQNQYGPAVLMATQPVGAGRVTFLGFSSTWRWRATTEPVFNRFWVRLVRYLAQARRQAPSKRGSITLDRETFSVGDYVKIEARLLDDAYNPAQTSEVAATLESPGEAREEFVLEAITERAGWYAGRLLLRREGPAVIRVPLPTTAEGAGSPASLAKRLRVQRPDVEMRALRLRTDVLAPLAEQTGGEYCTLEDIDRLPELVRKATERKAPQRAAVQPLWDRNWVLLVLAALLTVEWTVRRRNHLL